MLRKLSLQTLVLTAMISSAGIAFGAIICYPEGDCHHSDQGCEDFIPGDGADCCNDDDIINKLTDYVLKGSGKTEGKYWIVTAKKGKIGILSDDSMTMLKGMAAKYPREKRNDPKVKKQIKADFQKLSKEGTKGRVSPARVTAIAKKLELSILDKEKSKK